ncbi:hypothetical protein LCGC14_0248490 [marine sediment metagenome]|uniref:Uncharacterized protein n=1 Tax=marine sediment metagenome TaxID=412755 RepID=A0A0F9ULI3_9ZZZZ
MTVTFDELIIESRSLAQQDKSWGQTWDVVGPQVDQGMVLGRIVGAKHANRIKLYLSWVSGQKTK